MKNHPDFRLKPTISPKNVEPLSTRQLQVQTIDNQKDKKKKKGSILHLVKRFPLADPSDTMSNQFDADLAKIADLVKFLEVA